LKTNIQIKKSSRHPKITGDFAESMVLYWLSKYGFECVKVDHTGIDLIAVNPKTKELMGISVKSRSRNKGKEGQYVSIPVKNFEKVKKACNDFNCIPYFAILVDEENTIWIYITSMKHLLNLFPLGNRVSGWKMTEKHKKNYLKDNEIFTIKICHNVLSWW